ncbi:hypothetical protein HAX54_048241, partial [Datura stramonium]|nr:hypothetical protein [Datura stramonium]
MAPKGKEVVIGEKSRKRGRLRKIEASSSAPKAGPTGDLMRKQLSLMGLVGLTLKKKP